MFRSPPHTSTSDQGRPSKNIGIPRYPRKAIELEIDTGNEDDLVRNRSHDTETTVSGSVNSTSGIYSIELLAEVYPPIEESSESEGEDNDSETAVHMNRMETVHTSSPTAKVDDTKPEEVAGSSPTSSAYESWARSFTISSHWLEDRPFDEETLRAKSEILSNNEGDNAFSKGSGATQEYILPPVSDSRQVNGISPYYEKPYNVTKNSSRATSATVPIVHILPGNELGPEDDSLGSKSVSSGNAVGKNGNDSRKKSRKFCIIACIIIVCAIAIGVAIGMVEYRKRNRISSSENQATGLQSDLNGDAPDEAFVSNNETDSTESEEPAMEMVGVENPSFNITQEPQITITPVNTQDPPSQSVSDSPPWADEFEPTVAPIAPSTTSPPWGTLINYPDPVSDDFFPLGHCMGDCDKDDDCEDGLICYQRGANDPVPFCFGGETDFTRTDYCTYPDEGRGQPLVDDENQSSQECVSTVSIVQDCLFLTENVVIVEFENCDPQDEDWIGVYADGASFSEGQSSSEWVSDDWIDWAFTCGDMECEETPSTFSFAFPTNENPAFDLASVQVYLLRNTPGGPPYEVVAKSEPFAPIQSCGGI